MARGDRCEPSYIKNLGVKFTDKVYMSPGKCSDTSCRDAMDRVWRLQEEDQGVRRIGYRLKARHPIRWNSSTILFKLRGPLRKPIQFQVAARGIVLGIAQVKKSGKQRDLAIDMRADHA